MLRQRRVTSALRTVSVPMVGAGVRDVVTCPVWAMRKARKNRLPGSVEQGRESRSFLPENETLERCGQTAAL